MIEIVEEDTNLIIIIKLIVVVVIMILTGYSALNQGLRLLQSRKKKMGFSNER